MTNDMLSMSLCDTAGGGGLGSNLGFGKMKSSISLSLGLSQFLSAICGSSLTSVGSSRILLIKSVMMMEHAEGR